MIYLLKMGWLIFEWHIMENLQQSMGVSPHWKMGEEEFKGSCFYVSFSQSNEDQFP